MERNHLDFFFLHRLSSASRSLSCILQSQHKEEEEEEERDSNWNFLYSSCSVTTNEFRDAWNECLERRQKERESRLFHFIFHSLFLSNVHDVQVIVKRTWIVLCSLCCERRKSLEKASLVWHRFLFLSFIPNFISFSAETAAPEIDFFFLSKRHQVLGHQINPAFAWIIRRDDAIRDPGIDRLSQFIRFFETVQ